MPDFCLVCSRKRGFFEDRTKDVCPECEAIAVVAAQGPPDIGSIQACRSCRGTAFKISNATVSFVVTVESDESQASAYLGPSLLTFAGEPVYYLLCNGCGLLELRCPTHHDVRPNPLLGTFEVHVPEAPDAGPYR
jgi:hypothetical protein